MLILAIDPGPTVCGWVQYDTDGATVLVAEVLPVADALECLRDSGFRATQDTLAIETFEARGMPLGNESMETLIVTGRIIEAWGNDATVRRVKRSAVKLHLCGSNRAKDANVNAALRDRFGGASSTVSPKKGRKATAKRAAEPDREAGPLYGVTSHCWAALAVAVTVADGVGL